MIDPQGIDPSLVFTRSSDFGAKGVKGEYSTFATKWDFDKMGFRLPNGKQEKYFENGISIKWDSLTTFSAWRTKWDYDILFFKL